MVPPFDHEWIIAGQGTAGLEILEQQPGRRRRARARSAAADWPPASRRQSSSRGPDVKVIGVEPAGAAKMKASVDAGQPVTLAKTETIADGLMPVQTRRLDVRARAASSSTASITVEDPRHHRARCSGSSPTRGSSPSRAARPRPPPSSAAPLDAALRIDGPIVAIVSGGNMARREARRMVGVGRRRRARDERLSLSTERSTETLASHD